MSENAGRTSSRADGIDPIEAGSRAVARVEPGEPQSLWAWLASKRHRLPLHPITAIAILVCDWFLFSGTVASLGFLTIFLSILGFFLGFLATGLGQTYFANERVSLKLLIKSIIGGLVVGVPFPVTGTLVAGGTVVLAKLLGPRPASALTKAAADLGGLKVPSVGGPSAGMSAERERAAQDRVGVNRTAVTMEPPSRPSRDAEGKNRSSIRGELSSLERKRSETQSRLDELYRDHHENPPHPGGAGTEPAGIEMFSMQLDQLDREIAALERRL